MGLQPFSPVTPVLGAAALLLAGCVAAEPIKRSGSGSAGSAGSAAGPAIGLSIGTIALLVVLVSAFAGVGFWAGRRSRPAPSPPAPDLQLVTGLIGSHDLTGDHALHGHIEQVLHRVGVVALRPVTGSPAADGRIEIVGRTPAPSPRLVGAVAEVLRVGWTDGSVLVRPAQVLVFAEPVSESGAMPPGPNDHGEPHR